MAFYAYVHYRGSDSVAESSTAKISQKANLSSDHRKEHEMIDDLDTGAKALVFTEKARTDFVSQKQVYHRNGKLSCSIFFSPMNEYEICSGGVHPSEEKKFFFSLMPSKSRNGLCLASVRHRGV